MGRKEGRMDGEGDEEGLNRSIWNGGSVRISKIFFFFLHIGENF